MQTGCGLAMARACTKHWPCDWSQTEQQRKKTKEKEKEQAETHKRTLDEMKQEEKKAT